MKTFMLLLLAMGIALGTFYEIEESNLLGLSPNGLHFAILHKWWEDGPKSKSECAYAITVYQTDTQEVERDFYLGSLPAGSDENNNADPQFKENIACALAALVDLGITTGFTPEATQCEGVMRYIVNPRLWLDFSADYPRQTYSLQLHDGSLEVKAKGCTERNDIDEWFWHEYSVIVVQFSPDLTHCVVIIRHYNGHSGCYQKDTVYSFKTEFKQKEQ